NRSWNVGPIPFQIIRNSSQNTWVFFCIAYKNIAIAVCRSPNGIRVVIVVCYYSFGVCELSPTQPTPFGFQFFPLLWSQPVVYSEVPNPLRSADYLGVSLVVSLFILRLFSGMLLSPLPLVLISFGSIPFNVV